MYNINLRVKDPKYSITSTVFLHLSYKDELVIYESLLLNKIIFYIFQSNENNFSHL
jgi:hypothetical protein